ncbi:spermatogenesis-associated protein 20 [Venturia canescens]|uniref:spermatogenesis-associated protein 20 n=1 Tax=Venturia canescens TaxID=32260 RepID=UPI001C9CF6D3|nr:spermatogenesis-associated protein 20 [Venturia canescens]
MISGRCSILSVARYVSEIFKCYGNNNGAGIICSDSFFQTINRRQVERSPRNIMINISSRAMASSSSDSSQCSKQNKLALEKSPYLLQHASNPVQWYPWGDEALEKARREDKLIFLSVGYSTCHWCHVMEKESFENPDTAEIMNRYFINIKVDREERPDIDKIYMTFIQTISGHGGWPMNVFLTPDLVPITGGTYFPPSDKYGQPGFEKVLITVAHQWLENKKDLLQSGSKILEVLKRSATSKKSSSENDVPSVNCGKTCVEQLSQSYDREFGGFSEAPKFPQPVNLNLLFHEYSRDPTSELGKKCLEMCLHTLTKMANGGIHDHVGQGFSRYSVDDKWHVPHFEKMLYDQGQLLRSYADAFLATKDQFYADILDDIVTYVTRDLRHPEGGFYSAEDADSLPTKNSKSKKEGAFYVWTHDEIQKVLNEKVPHVKILSDLFSHHYHVQKEGNVEKRQDPHGELTGQNVLIVYGSVDETAHAFGLNTEETNEYLKEARALLFKARSLRPRPHLDSKIVTAWNGLIISGLARAGSVTKNKKYVSYAEDAAKFVERYLFDKTKKVLLRSCYRGEKDAIIQPATPIEGFHVDYAFLVSGLLDLYEASLNDHWLEFAQQLQDIQDKLFWDCENGGYFSTTLQDSSVILRLKDDSDGAEPSSNSVACSNLLRLSSFFDRPDYKEKAGALLASFYRLITRIPAAVPELVSALLHYHDSTTQIFIAGKKDSRETEEMVNVVRERLIPAKSLLLVDPYNHNCIVYQKNEIASKMSAREGQATAYVCRHHACSLPVSDPSQLAELLDSRE